MDLFSGPSAGMPFPLPYSICTRKSSTGGANVTNESSPVLGSEGASAVNSSKTQTFSNNGNDPHESLEYPPLYFFLKRFPMFKSCFQVLYRLRWSSAYPLQKRVPFSRKMRKVGLVVTWGELLLLLPFVAILLSSMWTSFVNPSVELSGQVARLPVVVAFVTANHNSILTLLLGIPFERALKYHKLAGRIAFINGIFHTYVSFFHPVLQPISDDRGLSLFDHTDSLDPSTTQSVDSDDPDDVLGSASEIAREGEGFQNYSSDEATETVSQTTFEPPAHSVPGSDTNFAFFAFNDQINTSGSVILLLIIGILLTSLPPVRNRLFEFFYYVHIMFAASMVGCAFFHSGALVVILASLFWGGDLITRKLVMACVRYPRKAKIGLLTESVVELSFTKTKGFDYNPGQYVYLAVPELSIFQWHPFSISSSPHQETVTIHIRKRGNWTKALYNLAEKQEEVSVLIEGPFGSLGVDLVSERYKMVMLLSGGIGVTPMQSICHQLMHEYENGNRKLKKLWFIWTARDPAILNEMNVSRRSRRRSLASDIFATENIEIENIGVEGRPALIRQPTTSNLARKVLMQLPTSNATDGELESEYPLDELEEDGELEEEGSLDCCECHGAVPDVESGENVDSCHEDTVNKDNDQRVNEATNRDERWFRISELWNGGISRLQNALSDITSSMTWTSSDQEESDEESRENDSADVPIEKEPVPVILSERDREETSLEQEMPKTQLKRGMTEETACTDSTSCGDEVHN